MARAIRNLAAFFALLSAFQLANAFPHHIRQSDSATEFEYIVVGSGPGGGPLAANLARQNHSVLLLEAGQDHGDTDLQRVPFFADANSEHPNMSWEFFVSHYQNDTQAQLDSKFTWRTPNGSYHVGSSNPPPPEGSEALGIFYPRTGTLGGCAQHNAMNMVYPPDEDWEFIADLTGDDGFSAEHMRELFVRLERSEFFPEGTEGHGFDGYLSSILNDIDLVAQQPGLLEIIRNHMIEAGDAPPEVTNDDVLDLLQRDQNRPDADRYEQDTLFQLPVHIDSDRRRSGSQTYLYETRDAGIYLLTIRTNAFVTRVLFEENDGDDANHPRAVGVNYLEGVAMYSADRRYNSSDQGISHKVYASREVIVAGGVFNTPQILKLSGIGPREELEQFDIPVLVDLPAVGKNMQDNYEAALVVEGSQPFETNFEQCTPFEDNDPCLEQWRTNSSNRGPYGQGAATVSMIMRSSLSENENADLFFFGGAGGVFRGHYPGFSEESYPPETFFWSVVKMQTQNSAGSVRLRSGDPRDMPEIAFNSFAEGREHDIGALAEGFEFARRALSRPGQEYGPYEWVQPREDETDGESIANELYSHHATSTCVMGADDDFDACVDSRFQVRGVNGLRVVDGSVFPRVPGAFPVLPTFMLSEKATDDILAAAVAE